MESGTCLGLSQHAISTSLLLCVFHMLLFCLHPAHSFHSPLWPRGLPSYTHSRGSLMDCHILPTDCKVHEGKSHANFAHNLSPGPQKYPTQRRCSIFVELRDEYTEERTLAPDSSLLLCRCLRCGPTQNSPAVTRPWP